MTKGNFSIYLAAIFIAILSSCKPKQVAFNVTNINTAKGLRNYTTMYALPKSAIRVNVKVKKTIYKKGPYSNYATSKLSLKNVIKQDRIEWEINDIVIETYPIVDSNQIYIVETNSPLNLLDINLQNNGIIKSVNVPLIHQCQFENTEETISSDNCKKKTYLVTDFDQIPLPKAILSKTSDRERAEELSRLIQTLRTDLAATLIGDGYTETVPNGNALRIMVDEINLLQAKYLSMFKGIEYNETKEFSFTFVPEESRKITQKIIFRFSKENGVVPEDNMSGEPVILEIESLGTYNNFNQFTKNQTYLKRSEKNPNNIHGLFYRIPESAIARLINQDTNIAEAKIQLPQFGIVNSLPSKYLQREFSIEFYPELGSLKSIKRLK